MLWTRQQNVPCHCCHVIKNYHTIDATSAKYDMSSLPNHKKCHIIIATLAKCTMSSKITTSWPSCHLKNDVSSPPCHQNCHIITTYIKKFHIIWAMLHFCDINQLTHVSVILKYMSWAFLHVVFSTCLLLIEAHVIIWFLLIVLNSPHGSLSKVAFHDLVHATPRSLCYNSPSLNSFAICRNLVALW